MAGGSRKGAVRRIFSSVARRAALFARPDPFDIEIFAGQRARLYPRDNLCEKRVFARSAWWDRKEREKISWIIAAHKADRPLVFVDAGANVGMYTLFVLGEAAVAGCDVRILAIEPDPVNRQRLAFNIEASGAADRVKIVDRALGSDAQTGHLTFAGSNRGEIRLATTNEMEASGHPADAREKGRATGKTADEFVKVAIIPLATLLADENIETVDILKIDIEGGEADVFRAFFAKAEPALFPRWIVLETISGTGAAALKACQAAGYEIALQTRMNAVLKLQKTQDG